MKAAVCYQPGGPEVFRYEDVPDPEPTPDGVLVRVEAISVEGGDLLHRARDQVSGGPHIVGYQAVGIVLVAGGHVTRFQPGDRVVTVGMDGSHAEFRAVQEQLCWAIPHCTWTRSALSATPDRMPSSRPSAARNGG